MRKASLLWAAAALSIVVLSSSAVAQTFPARTVARIHADIARVLSTPESRPALAAQGIEAALAPPETLAQTIRDDHARWGKVISDANIMAD